MLFKVYCELEYSLSEECSSQLLVFSLLFLNVFFPKLYLKSGPEGQKQTDIYFYVRTYYLISYFPSVVYRAS